MTTQQPPSNRNRRLVLYFDINNTILMKDKAKNISSVAANVSYSCSLSLKGREDCHQVCLGKGHAGR